MKVGGFSIVELTASLAISGLVLLALQQMVQSTASLKAANAVQNNGSQALECAMSRMVKHAEATNRLLLPGVDNAATATDESIRDQTVGITGVTAVLAVTLPSSVDRDGDGFADADNDRDGRVDEDPGQDMSNDGAPGMFNIDDDADQIVDEGGTNNDDEYLSNNEDPLDGIDNDGDGSVDEDWGDDINGDGEPGVAGIDDDGDGSIDEGNFKDDDEDGTKDEDWLDPVVYYLSGDTLVERQPANWDENGDTTINGLDVVESVILENVTRFRVERVAITETSYPLVDLLISAKNAEGETQTLQTRVRVGSGA